MNGHGVLEEIAHEIPLEDSLRTSHVLTRRRVLLDEPFEYLQNLNARARFIRSKLAEMDQQMHRSPAGIVHVEMEA